MRSSMRRLWCVVVTVCAASALHAATPSDESARESVMSRALSLTPRELLKLVRGERLVPTWRERGSQFWFAADRADGVEYLRVDPDSRSVQPLFDRDKLAAAVRKVAGMERSTLPDELEGFAFDFDRDEVSFDYGGRRWSYSTRADRLQPTEKVAGGISPDGRWQALARDSNLYLADKLSGAVRQLTTDGSPLRPYARPIVSLKDMVSQGTSEPQLDADVVWSPDSTRFVTYRMNLEGARRLSAVQSTPPAGAPPRVFDYVYPMSGDERVPIAQTLVVNAVSGAITPVISPTHEALYYGGPQFQWTRDSTVVLQEVVARGYGSLRLYSIDATTGASALLFDDAPGRFVDFYSHRWKDLSGADAVAWLSDASGWNQASLIDRNGKRRALTTGEWTVAEIAGGDAAGRLFVVGRGREGARDPYLGSLYRVDRDGRKTTLLTPEPLDHDVQVSPDGRYFVDNQSLVNRPTTSSLRSTRNGAVIMKLQEADISELTKRGVVLPEPFEVMAADGATSLYGVVYKPSTFDPRKQYPVIEYLYTGPHAITAPKTFEAGLRLDVAYAVAELGYVVVVVDGRGASGRGRAFLEPAYQNLHAVGLDDHIAAIRTLAVQRPYLDATKVGVYGFSAGGYDVVRAMTERPDFYKVGIAASGNHDNRLDKAIWNEQWMGYPLGPQYDTNSNIRWAPKLAGKLFLAHGELDENVPPAATLRLVEALLRAKKSFELLIVPNADHYLSNAVDFNRRRFEFLLDNIAPPSW